ncbi:MAG TPA: anthranilate synthase component I family protein [Crocinitomicaceae bacterium]|nr:anthranilate synthase component I family protein [Crocinitomicaceae bacterium]
METIAYFFDEQTKKLFWGKKSALKLTSNQTIDELQTYLDQHPNSYKVIALSYDLKNSIESKLTSENQDFIHFPDVVCWQPELVIDIHENEFQILDGNPTEKQLSEIQEFINETQTANEKLPHLSFRPHSDKQAYITAVTEVLREIQYGNSYEVNFCQSFVAENVPEFASTTLIQKLYELTKAPFSAYLKVDEFELFCGSPERFLKKAGTKLISQPIKGTVKRGQTQAEDEQLKQHLKQSQKEQSENVMIVDLVRNDLSIVAQKGSVNVEELAEIHSFNTVHHLISKIACELKENATFTDILKATFPMGSMTGAPKISTMNIIERLENFKRGIYSGSVGYITPNGDFDLNVVIRSLIKNNQTQTMSCSVGGAITIQSDIEKEYEECLVKVGKILELFNE